MRGKVLFEEFRLFQRSGNVDLVFRVHEDISGHPFVGFGRQPSDETGLEVLSFGLREPPFFFFQVVCLFGLVHILQIDLLADAQIVNLLESIWVFNQSLDSSILFVMFIFVCWLVVVLSVLSEQISHQEDLFLKFTLNQFLDRLRLQLLCKALIVEVEFSFRQFLLNFFPLHQKLLHNSFDFVLKPILIAAGANYLLAVVVVSSELFIDEVGGDEAFLSTDLVDVVFKLDHVVEVVLHQFGGLELNVIVLVEIGQKGFVDVCLDFVIAVASEIISLQFGLSVDEFLHEFGLRDEFLSQESIVDLLPVLTDQQEEAFETVREYVLVIALVGKFESVQEVQKLILRRFDMFLSAHMHIDEEVQERNNFFIDFIKSDFTAVVEEVDIVFLPDMLDDLSHFRSLQAEISQLDQHLLDE